LTFRFETTRTQEEEGGGVSEGRGEAQEGDCEDGEGVVGTFAGRVGASSSLFLPLLPYSSFIARSDTLLIFCDIQSGIQLCAAAVQADIEDYKADNAAILDTFDNLVKRAPPLLSPTRY
jgi:hypothetical protein